LEKYIGTFSIFLGEKVLIDERRMQNTLAYWAHTHPAKKPSKHPEKIV
jgi:hypothetical protein